MSRIINSVHRSPIKSRVQEIGQGERLGGVIKRGLVRFIGLLAFYKLFLLMLILAGNLKVRI